jgi:hypothetical protein
MKNWHWLTLYALDGRGDGGKETGGSQLAA